jgi:hypothetical protein
MTSAVMFAADYRSGLGDSFQQRLVLKATAPQLKIRHIDWIY